MKQPSLFQILAFAFVAIAPALFAAPADFNAVAGYGTAINGELPSDPALTLQRSSLSGAFFDASESEIIVENIALVGESTEPDGRVRLGFTLTLRNTGPAYFEDMDIEFEKPMPGWNAEYVFDPFETGDLPPHSSVSRPEPYELLVPATEAEAAKAAILAGQRLRPNGRELHQFTLPSVAVDPATDLAFLAHRASLVVPGALEITFSTMTPQLAALTAGTLLVESPGFNALVRPEIPPPLDTPTPELSDVVAAQEIWGPIDYGQERKTKIVEVTAILPQGDGTVIVRGHPREMKDVIRTATFFQRPVDAFDDPSVDPYFTPLGNNGFSRYSFQPSTAGTGPRHRNRAAAAAFHAMHFPINDVTLAPGITLDGEVLIDALNVEMKVRFRDALPVRMAIRLATKSEVTLRLTASARANNTNAPLFQREQEIFSVPLPPLIFNIAGVPVDIQPIIKVKVGAEINAPTTVVIPVQASVETGVVTGWDKSRPAGQQFFYTPFTNSRPLTMSDPLLHDSLALSASVFAEAGLAVEINHLAGPYVGARVTGEFTLSPLANPWWSLDAGLDLTAAFRIHLLGLDLADVSGVFIDGPSLFHKDPGVAVPGGSGAPGGSQPGSHSSVSGGQSRWVRTATWAGSGPSDISLAHVVGTREDVFGIAPSNVVNQPVFRLGERGELVWAKSLGLVNPKAIAATPDGGFVLSGTYIGGFVSRHDGDGTLIWSRNFKPSTSPFNIRSVIVREPAPGQVEIYVAGEMNNSLSTFDVDPFLIKYDGDGNLIWLKRYASVNMAETIAQVILLQDGHLLFCGTAKGNRDSQIAVGGGSEYGGFLMKVTPDGVFEWANRSLSSIEYKSVTESPDGTIFTGGLFFRTVTLDMPAFLVGRHSARGLNPLFVTVGENMAGANPVASDWLPNAGLTPYDVCAKVLWTPIGLVAGGSTGLGINPAFSERAAVVMAFSEQLSVRWWTTHEGLTRDDHFFDMVATDDGILTAGHTLSFGSVAGGLLPVAFLAKLPWDGKIDLAPELGGISKYLLPSSFRLQSRGELALDHPAPDQGYDGTFAIPFTTVDQTAITNGTSPAAFVSTPFDLSGPLQRDTVDFGVQPSATTLDADASRTSALLHGLVNPGGVSGTARFEWGTDAAALVNSTPPTNVGRGRADVAVKAPLTGLVEGTTVFFRTRLDAGGAVHLGEVKSFIPRNNGPSSNADSGLVVPGPGPSSLLVLSNDTDPDGDALTIVALTQPSHGTATISPDGTAVLYDPDDDYTGPDSFSYAISDGMDGGPFAPVNLTVGCERSPVALLTITAATGDPLPDPTLPDGVLTLFGVPAIADSGALVSTVAFRIGRIRGEGIYSQNASGEPSLIARSGGAVAGMPGVTFARFGDPAISPSGAVAFTAKIGGRGVNVLNDDGVWSTAAGSLRRAIAEGGTPPFLGGASVRQIVSFSIRDGEILALLTLSGSGVSPANNSALVRVAHDGNGVILARKGSPVGGGVTTNISRISALFPARGSEGHGRSHADTAFTAKLTLADRSEALVSYANDGTPSLLLASHGSAAAVATGARWAEFGLPALSTDGGAIATLATLKVGPGGIAANSDSALVFSDTPATLEVIARENGPAPGAGGALFGAFIDPVVNADHTIAFAATLRGTGVTRSNALGLWAGDSAAPVLIARTGGTATDADGQPIAGAIWKLFTTHALPGCGASGPVFIARIAGTGITNTNNTGLWASDSAGLVRQLLRTGDVLDGKTISSFTLLNVANGPFDASRSFNQQGTLALRLTFTDRSQALVRIDVP